MALVSFATEPSRALALALVILSLACSRARADDVPPDGVRPLAATVARGVAYAHDWGARGALGYGSPSDRAQLDRLRALGATWVCVMPFGYLRSRDELAVRSSYTRDGAERDAALVATIREAHARGLHVLLKPHLWVHGSWPGDVDPAREDDARALVDSWASLTRHYADLAASEHVEALTVGVEMDRLARHVPDRWRALIADTRTRFHGTLTYSANWSEVATVPFWDALDVVSVNHYAPLADAPGPSVRADVDARARAALAAHVAVARRYGRSLWLTEVGFRRDARALVEPWRWVQQSRAPLMDLQSTGYAATFRAIAAEPTVSAVFAWKWFTSGGDEEEGERGFVFTGRPAEAIVRRAFARP